MESDWRQFAAPDRPLVSFDFGYGIMQITSGMAGAYGSPTGDLDPAVQSRIASDPQYNIAYGAMILASKWNATPRVGDRDPTSVEDWYYALWAYNGWGWQNNPNNPRFSRRGTPASDPAGFPYQERVLYFVAHPPRDAEGNLLWVPVNVSLPSRKAIGRQPAALPLTQTHRQPPPAISATYKLTPPRTLAPGAVETAAIGIRNTGTATWQASGAGRLVVRYNLFPAGASSDAAAATSLATGSIPLSRALPPGAWLMIQPRITAPSVPGVYTLVWGLREGDGLSQPGVVSMRETLSVVKAGTALAPTASPTPAPTTPVEGLRYVADTAAADGASIQPSTAFVKAWLVFNDGRRAWQSLWTARRINGTPMGPSSVVLPLTQPCRSANILAALRAPSTPGTYRETWQLEDPQGHRAGDVLTLRIVVRAKPTLTPTPAPSTAIPTAPVPTATPIG